MAEFDACNSVVIDDDDVMDWVRSSSYPDAVFSIEDLALWAEDNGYIKEGTNGS